MRDAHQSLLATRMRTDDLVNIAAFYSNKLSDLFSIKFNESKTLNTSIPACAASLTKNFTTLSG